MAISYTLRYHRVISQVLAIVGAAGILCAGGLFIKSYPQWGNTGQGIAAVCLILVFIAFIVLVTRYTLVKCTLIIDDGLHITKQRENSTRHIRTDEIVSFKISFQKGSKYLSLRLKGETLPYIFFLPPDTYDQIWLELRTAFPDKEK